MSGCRLVLARVDATDRCSVNVGTSLVAPDDQEILVRKQCVEVDAIARADFAGRWKPWLLHAVASWMVGISCEISQRSGETANLQIGGPGTGRNLIATAIQKSQVQATTPP